LGDSENAMKQVLHLRVNGEDYDVYVPVHKTLLEVLREDLNLTGTKHGCELGECGACTVLVTNEPHQDEEATTDLGSGKVRIVRGEPILSCLALPVELQGREITTVEGLARGPELHPLQQAFAELGAAQCGYCTPGILLTAKSLLDHNPAPTREEIREALAGNLCRCTGYTKILEAVELVVETFRRNVSTPGGGYEKR
jgi:aerobic-type carbon monoxide dehydrogenase small subunit (CoxS/CutS family)